MSEKLKPCPLCGCANGRRYHDDFDDDELCECMDCEFCCSLEHWQALPRRSDEAARIAGEMGELLELAQFDGRTNIDAKDVAVWKTRLESLAAPDGECDCGGPGGGCSADCDGSVEHRYCEPCYQAQSAEAYNAGKLRAQSEQRAPAEAAPEMTCEGCREPIESGHRCFCAACSMDRTSDLDDYRRCWACGGWSETFTCARCAQSEQPAPANGSSD